MRILVALIFDNGAQTDISLRLRSDSPPQCSEKHNNDHIGGLLECMRNRFLPFGGLKCMLLVDILILLL